jgi:nucleoside-diphosphate-sugar epimerase
MILLTGNSGFLGKSIVRNLSAKKISFLSIGRNIHSDIVCDLSIKIPIINKEIIDLVVHAAGKVHSIPKSSFEKSQFYNDNINITENLLKGLELAGYPKKFVFISSVSVYGRSTGNNIFESEMLNSNDPYGLSKIHAEKIVFEWCKENNVICTILRLPLLVGNNPPGNLGAMIKGIQKGYYFNIRGGAAKKSMVLAEDVAKIIIEVAKIGGTYNLTDGYHPTFAEISNTISNQLEKKKPINIPNWFAVIVAKIGDLIGNKAPLNTNKLKKITSDLTFDDSKARKAFGWNPTPVLDGFRIIKE